MIRHFKLAVYISATTMLAATIAGCERQTTAPKAVAEPAPQTTVQLHGEGDSVSARQANAIHGEAGGTKDTMQISSSSAGQSGPAGTQPAASNAEPGKPVGKSDAAPSAKAPKVEAKDAYKEEKPTLLGLSLKAPLDSVQEKLGTAKSKFVMDDDTDPITVYEYTGFSVGFNKNEALEFVDVHAAEVDPGLHGLRIGQTSEDAFAALGKPDTNSTYVLSYKSQGTILKLDLDPKTDTIRSIKLFATK
jgi:hypothetical protein